MANFEQQLVDNQNIIKDMMVGIGSGGGGGGVVLVDDGQNYVFKRGNEALFKVSKADKSLIVSGDFQVDGDITFGDASVDTITVNGAMTMNSTLTSGADGAGAGDIVFYGDTATKKMTWNVSDDMLDIDGIMKVHNRPVSTDTYALEVKIDYKQSTGPAQGAFQCSTRVYPTSNTSAVDARGGYFQCQLHADDTMTAGGMTGLYTQVHNNGTGILNGAAIQVESLRTDIADGGTWTAIERLCSLKVTSNLSQTISAGLFDLLYISNDGSTVADNAINVGTGTYTTGLTLGGTLTNGIVIGACTTGLTISGATTTGMSITGSATDAINIDTGTFTNGININGGTISKAIRMGSYSSRLTAVSGSTTEVCTIGILGAEDDFTIGYGSYIRTSGEDGKGFGASFLVEATNTTGTPTLQGLQSMAFLGSVGGSEAAHLKTLGGDATAGLYGGWFKIGANSNCVADSGSRAAALWVDNQMGGTISGEEYGIFATTGGSKPDAFIGFETTSSGWASLFYFDETSYDQDPVVSGDATSGSKDYHLKVNINGNMYGLQLYAL